MEARQINTEQAGTVTASQEIAAQSEAAVQTYPTRPDIPAASSPPGDYQAAAPAPTPADKASPDSNNASSDTRSLPKPVTNNIYTFDDDDKTVTREQSFGSRTTVVATPSAAPVSPVSHTQTVQQRPAVVPHQETVQNNTSAVTPEHTASPNSPRSYNFNSESTTEIKKEQARSNTNIETDSSRNAQESAPVHNSINIPDVFTIEPDNEKKDSGGSE